MPQSLGRKPHTGWVQWRFWSGVGSGHVRWRSGFRHRRIGAAAGGDKRGQRTAANPWPRAEPWLNTGERDARHDWTDGTARDRCGPHLCGDCRTRCTRSTFTGPAAREFSAAAQRTDRRGSISTIAIPTSNMRYVKPPTSWKIAEPR